MSDEDCPPTRPSTSRRDRAVSSVVGKSVEAGIVVLYVSVLVAFLYGGAVPEYRAAAGGELGERVLAEAALEVQSAVPEDPGSEATVRFGLPATIEGTTYRIEAEDGSLVLVHPDDAIGDELPLALPGSVDRIEGAWHSSDRAVVRVEPGADGRVVELERGAG